MQGVCAAGGLGGAAESWSWPDKITCSHVYAHASDFTNVLITFLCNCLVVYFFVVLPMNALVEHMHKAKHAPAAAAAAEPEAPKPTRECPE